MTYEEKLKIVIKAILEAEKLSVPREPISLRTTKENKLDDLDSYDLLSIMKQLKQTYEVLVVMYPPNMPSGMGFGNPDERDYYKIALSQTFHSWANEQLNKRNREEEIEALKNIPDYRINAYEKIWIILKQIDDQVVLNSEDGSIKIRTKLNVAGKGIIHDYDSRKHILNKLETLGAIKDIKKINFNRTDYFKFYIAENYEEIYSLFRNKFENASFQLPKLNPKLNVTSENIGIVYKIKYSFQSREIILNDILIIKKLASFGNKDLIFDYLYKHPNQIIKLVDLEKATKIRDIDLNKFVEKAGFKGDLRKIFFKVSKDTIQFNNPISKEFLAEQGFSLIKL